MIKGLQVLFLTVIIYCHKPKESNPKYDNKVIVMFIIFITGEFKMITSKVKTTDSITDKIKDCFKMISSKIEKIEETIESKEHAEVDPNFYYFY